MKPIRSKTMLIIAGQVIGLAILLMGPFSVSSHGQVVAFWTDSSGNWSNSANWSTCPPAACPVVPNNGGGITYDVVLHGTGSDIVTFDASGTVITSLELDQGEMLSDNGHSPTLTVGNLTNGGTINWGSGSLLVTGSMGGGLFTATNIAGGSLLNIGGDYNTSTSFAGVMTVTGSTLKVQGSYFNVSYSGNLFDLAGSRAVIGGDFLNSNGSQVQLSASSLSVGGGMFVSFDGPTTIENGSTVIVGGDIAVAGGSFLLDKTSTATASSFLNENGNFGSAGANIDGALLVKGTLTNGGVNGPGVIMEIGGPTSVHAVQNDGLMTVNGTLSVNGGGFSNNVDGSLTISGVTNVKGGFTNSGGSVILNPSATLTADSYSQTTGTTDVSGTLSTASYKQGGGDTIIENGGIVSAKTFKATGGTVTVNGTLDPTAVEIGAGATLQGMGKIVGNVSMGGAMILGDPMAQIPGTIAIFGNYEQIGNGTLVEMISPSSHAFLNVNGDVALDSDSFLQISLVNGFFNPLGQTFSIMDYNSLVGQFANGSSFLADGFLWDITYGKHEIDVTAVPMSTPEPSSLLLLCIGVAGLALCAQRKMAKTHLLA